MNPIIMEKNKRISIRSKDMPIFASTDSKKLKIPELVGCSEEMGDMKGGRIPAIINAKLPENDRHDAICNSVIIAAADVGNEGSDWGCLSLGVRLSYDSGRSFTKLRKILSLQAHHAPQSDKDWQSPFVIDPVLVQAQDGSIVILIDMFPECMGFARSDWLDQCGYQKINGTYYLTLYDGESKVDGKQDADFGSCYTVREMGWVYDSYGNKTNYYMPKHHSKEYQFSTIGDLYYAVGNPDYLDTYPPLIPKKPESGEDIYVGNVFMSSEKHAFQSSHPIFVQKRKAGPNQSVYSDYDVLETDPAPLTAAVAMHLWSMISRDGGLTWEQPVDITMQCKTEEDSVFLGTGPGTGIVLSRQKEVSKNGRILFPLYNGTGRKECATAIFSDDNGVNWHRVSGTGMIQNKDEVQMVELFDGTLMSFGRQNEISGGDKNANPWKGRFPDTPVSYSYDGGETWSDMTTTSLPSVMCQKSVIAYPMDDGTKEDFPFSYPKGMTKGKQYIISARPTGVSQYEESARSDGTISLGEVQPDHSIHWIAHRVVTDTVYAAAKEEWLRNFFAYSSLCVLDNGNIGLLYEPLPNNYIAFMQFNLDWII